MKTSCCNSNESIAIGHNVVCLNVGCNNYLGSTTLYRNIFAWKKPIALSLFALQLMLSMEDFSMENKENNFSTLNVRAVKPMPLTLHNLQQELIHQSILCPHEVFAQMKLESASLSSTLLKKTNNLMGMRFALSRPTTAVGIYIPSKKLIVYGNQKTLRKYTKLPNFSVYSCWQDAVADYKLWQDYNFRVKERYLDYLGKVYAEDTSYVEKIKIMTVNDVH
jgi:hypothetical protein